MKTTGDVDSFITLKFFYYIILLVWLVLIYLLKLTNKWEAACF